MFLAFHKDDTTTVKIRLESNTETDTNGWALNGLGATKGMRVVRLGSGLALDTSSGTHTLPVASEQCFLAGRCQMMKGMQNSKNRKKKMKNRW